MYRRFPSFLSLSVPFFSFTSFTRLIVRDHRRQRTLRGQ